MARLDDQASNTDSFMVAESATMLAPLTPSIFAVIVTAPDPVLLINSDCPLLEPLAKVIETALAVLMTATRSVGEIAPLAVYVVVIAYRGGRAFSAAASQLACFVIVGRL